MSSERDVGDSNSDASSDLRRERLYAASTEANRLREELSVSVARDALQARLTQLELELQNDRGAKMQK